MLISISNSDLCSNPCERFQKGLQVDYEIGISGDMERGLLIAFLCMIMSLGFNGAEGSTYSRNLWKARHFHAERPYKATGRVLEDLAKRVSLSTVSLKNALSKDDIPAEREYVLHLRFSRSF